LNTEQNPKSASVLIISSDQEITKEIISNNNSGFDTFARESWDIALNEPDLLANTGITILDIDNFANNQLSVKQLIKIKQDDPTQILMVVGEKERLADFLKSSTQALVYRAFAKPASSSQILLAFKHGMTSHDDLVTRRDAGEDLTVVGPAENRATLDTISDQGKTNPLLYIAAGLALTVIVAWLAFSGGDAEQAPVVVNTPDIIEDESANQENLLPDISQINDLNQLAANAIFDGRLISPKGNNALEYYNQVLEMDSYDNTAYEGRQDIANQLRENYAQLIVDAKFGKALESLEVLKTIQPLNPQNEQMALALESQVQQHVSKVRASGSQEDIAKTSAILTDIGPKIKGSQNLSTALAAEARMLEQIDSALGSNILLPSQDGNAYDMVSDAIRKNSISQSNIKPRLLSLSDKLMQMASASFKTDQLDDASELLNLVKPLKVNIDKVEIAESKLKARRQEIALASIPSGAVADQPVAVEEAEPVEAKILPAKLLKRAAPSYPKNAMRRNIEGWVEVAFDIGTDGKPADIKVVNAQPEGIFEKAAMRSIKKWRFQPAKNELTDEIVVSKVTSTKVSFRLQ